MGNTFRFALLFALTAGLALAQITGDIKGVVLDSSSAVVANAAVTLKSLETGETRTVTTGAEGLFTFSLLKIGRYEVRAERSGFRTALTQAEVKTGEITSVQFRLEVGQVTETITVTDAVSQLDTENAQLQTSVAGSECPGDPGRAQPQSVRLDGARYVARVCEQPVFGIWQLQLQWRPRARQQHYS